MLETNLKTCQSYLRLVNSLSVFCLLGFYLIPLATINILPIGHASLWYVVSLFAGFLISVYVSKWLATKFNLPTHLMLVAIFLPTLTYASYTSNGFNLVLAVVLLPLFLILVVTGLTLLRRDRV